ncbi:hypothetical protein AZE42_03722 [Rhizopogon vesiculosus]|uniref:Uncharacterized protein n=1 Tax=Rhizopogon vesiculosus TaxID=180088 RepID=A0A1J8QG96_9AGAM|nr:hypothetical protein AZE42_03722 [Rhizopogon vesiculosus]
MCQSDWLLYPPRHRPCLMSEAAHIYDDKKVHPAENGSEEDERTNTEGAMSMPLAIKITLQSRMIESLDIEANEPRR